LTCAVAAWYLPLGGPFFIAAAAVLVPGPGKSPVGGSPLLVAGGRRERFLAMMVPILILGIIVTLGITATFAAMDLMRGHTFLGLVSIEAPKSSWSMETPMNLKAVVLLLALFPLARLLEVEFGGKGPRTYIGHRIVFIPAFILAMLKRPWLMAIPSVYVAFVFILSWAFCILGVHRIAMRRDLGRR
jgi:hypothetical protein